MTAVLRNECLTKTTNIRVIELFQNTNLSPEILQMGTILTIVIIVVVVIIIIIIRVRPAQFLRVYDLDRPPRARGAGYSLHDGGERAPAELMCHIVVRVYAGELVRREMPIDIPIVFQLVLLLHRRAERDFVPVAQDTRLSLENARSVNLHGTESSVQLSKGCGGGGSSKRKSI
jgi:hypothetical protein